DVPAPAFFPDGALCPQRPLAGRFFRHVRLLVLGFLRPGSLGGKGIPHGGFPSVVIFFRASLLWRHSGFVCRHSFTGLFRTLSTSARVSWIDWRTRRSSPGSVLPMD